MWAIRLQLLHPLNAIKSNKVKFKWNDVEQKTLYEIKQAVTQVTLSAYPDFNKCFDIHTDVRDWYLGAVIILHG